MALSAAESRQALSRITGMAEGALAELWRRLAGLSAVEVRDALMEAIPAIAVRYGDAAAAIAADWYEALRVEAEAKGAFAAVLAEQPGPARWESLVRWGMTPMFEPEPRPDTALQLISGGLKRSVADQHRLTVAHSAIADPSAKGWRRIGVGDTCSFCRMLLDRGAVFTEKSVEFKSHDSCRCAAAPVWDDSVRKVIGTPYVASKRRQTDADRRHVREYLAANYGN